MAGNSSLGAAKVAKVDEFYTQLADIENELRHYREHFRGKTVLCNCDDPRISNFFKYFALNFELLGLKRLIATCYKNSEPDIFSQHECEQAVYIIYEGDKNGNKNPDPEEMNVIPLKGDGDFRSQECIELLKQADIVCTNPPFSLFREYLAQLIKYQKQFIIIGNLNAIHYKEVFPLIRQNKLWMGQTRFNGGAAFFFGSIELYDPKKMSSEKHAFIKDGKLYWRVNGVRWFTNIDIPKRHEELILYKTYNPDDYPSYLNYDGIDVSKVSEIPVDYFGNMGVPDTFVEVYNPEQFEILGLGSGDLAKEIGVQKNYRGRTDISYMKDGVPKCPYSRIIIRRKK